MPNRSFLDWSLLGPEHQTLHDRVHTWARAAARER